MTYQDIQKVNSEITMIDMKGKNYAMVPERVNAFRKLYPEGFIRTEIISNDGTTVLMKAKVGYYTEDLREVILASGFAQEVRGKGMVNGTSHIENCETSAVGRALGMIGLGINGGGICSAEELVNAITAQNQMKEEEKAYAGRPGDTFAAPDNQVSVTVTAMVPEDQAPVVQYLNNQMKILREARGISSAENKKLVSKQFDALVDAGIMPRKSMNALTMEEAEMMIDAIYKRFDPMGTVIKG
ncbi:MAG: hypothetical protein J6P40_07320 [Oscillospiraceae bacterium]|nr:hypothetical protein [Oscillospiraceae bacterium]